MTNLLKETLKAIKVSGHAVADICFIGSDDGKYRCTWEEYTQLADVEYYAGFGITEIATDLLLVFSDGSSMWRSEYDGAEAWEYAKPFKMPKKSKPIRTLKGNGPLNWINREVDPKEGV